MTRLCGIMQRASPIVITVALEHDKALFNRPTRNQEIRKGYSFLTESFYIADRESDIVIGAIHDYNTAAKIRGCSSNSETVIDCLLPHFSPYRRIFAFREE